MACEWVTYEEIPWQDLAFTSVRFALERIHDAGPHYGCYIKKDAF